MAKIVFVGLHDLMVPYVNAIPSTSEVVVYESGRLTVPLQSTISVIPLVKTLFGFERLFTSERSLPWYMKGLGEQLKSDAPTVIVVLDFIRLWYWQVLWYRFWHPNTRVVLYSETQRIPKDLLSRFAFIIFELIFILSERFLSAIMVFTVLGADFMRVLAVRTPVTIVPAPVDTEMFFPEESRTYMKDGIFRLLCNARFVPYKRHRDLFAAVARLRMSGVKVELTCIGRASSGRAQVEREADEFGVRDVVRFLEPMSRESLRTLYNEHDVLVLPSDNEAIGMVVPEAMACGIPTVTSDTTGANVYVLEEETGEIFKTSDSADMAECLRRICDNNVLGGYGQKARQHLIEKFTIGTLAPVFTQILIDN